MCSLTAYGQSAPGTFSITPKIGLSISNLSGDAPMQIAYAVTEQTGADWGTATETPANSTNVHTARFSGHAARYGFTGGVEFGYQLTKRFALAAEVMYSVQGAKYDDIDNPSISLSTKDVVADISGISVPVTARYYIYKGLSVRAGLQPNILSNKLKGDFYHNGTAIEIKDDKVEYLSKFGLSVPIGVSYECGPIVIDARASLGVTNIYNDKWEGSNSSSRNNVFALTVGYKFSVN